MMGLERDKLRAEQRGGADALQPRAPDGPRARQEGRYLHGLLCD
jgi:hypothetical protein